MLFNSMTFLVCFPVVVLLYYLIPSKLKLLWLLLISFAFYASFGLQMLPILLVSAAISYRGGILANRGQKTIAMIFAVFEVILLIGFKYLAIRPLFGNSILVPIGISYFTLTGIAYIIDVSRNPEVCEKNICVYLLYISFFPKVISGPIESTEGFLAQLRSRGKVHPEYDRIVTGLITMLWGYFMKLVIADRAAVYVNNAFGQVSLLSTVELLPAVILLGVQIYCDFAGYSAIAVGAAAVLGYDLIWNFNSPYLSENVSEFWNRWHVSLSTWLKKYIYIPLGGNRKGKIRQYINLVVTFIVSGFWHGTGLTFIVWGLLHGFYQIVSRVLGKTTDRVNTRLGTPVNSFGYRFFKVFITFIAVDFAWIFFRAGSLTESFIFIKRLILVHDWWKIAEGSVYSLGLNVTQMHILLLGILAVILVDCLEKYRNIRLSQWLMSQWVVFRIIIISILIFMCVVYGYYGEGFESGQFLYAAF